MSWLGDKINQLLEAIGKKRTPLLEAGKGEEVELKGKRTEFVTGVQEAAILSEQERAIQEAELAEKAAYNCLADMVAKQKFDDETHLGESMQKGMHRLQVEDHYMGYGHGKQVPVSDAIIRVYREIQRVMHETTDFSPGYGTVKNTELQQLLESKNLKLQDVLSKSGKSISARISQDFTTKGGSMQDFNSYDDEPLARQTMRNSIMRVFTDYINEMEHGK